MKDVELTAQLLLLIEEGPRSYSIIELDRAFSDRDSNWEARDLASTRFQEVTIFLKQLLDPESQNGQYITRSRLRNQADFYSLFGAIHELMASKALPQLVEGQDRITTFIRKIEQGIIFSSDSPFARYLEAARSASNDTGPRRLRMDIMKSVLVGNVQSE